MKGGTDTEIFRISGEHTTIFKNQDVQLFSGVDLVFTGSSNDGNLTTLGVVDPTGTRTIDLPDASGTIALTSQLGAKSFPVDGNTDFGALDGNDKFIFGQNFTTSTTLDINFDMNTDPKGGLATEDMGSVA